MQRRMSRRKLFLESLEPRNLMAIGDLDKNFAVDGILVDKILSPKKSQDMVVESIAKPSGGFFVGANVFNARYTAMVASHDSNGQLDTSFGDRGFSMVALSSGFERLVDIALQPDGKVALTGYVRNSSTQATSQLALARLNSNGSIDTTFGSNGLVYTGFGFHTGPSAIEVRPSGEILVLTAEFNGFHLVQYRSNGTLDTSFNQDGVVDFLADSFESKDMLLLSDGSVILSTVRSGSNGNDQVTLHKVLSNGTIDSTFGSGGTFQFNLEGQAYNQNSKLPLKLARSTDNQIVVAGTLNSNAKRGFFAFQVSDAGALNTSFGVSGRFEATFADQTDDSLHDLQIASNGSIILSGKFGLEAKGVVVYATAAGVLSRTTNLDIVVHYDDFGATIQSGSRLLFVTNTPDLGASKDIQIVALNSNGDADPTFGTNGKVTTNVLDTIASTEAYDVTVLPSGAVLALVANNGGVNANGIPISLAKYSHAGVPDTSYGIAGKKSIGNLIQFLGFLTPQFIRSGADTFVVLQDQATARIAKLTSNGDIDTTIGTDGWVSWTFSPQTQAVYDVVVTNQAIFFGSSDTIGNYTVTKLNRSGVLQTSFGVNGIVNIPFQGSMAGSGIRLEAQGSNLLLMLSNHVDDSAFAIRAMRMDSTGQMDSTFGVSGFKVLGIRTGFGTDTLRNLFVLADGSFLVVGSASQALADRVTIERYTANGSLMLDFGTNGRTSMPLVNSSQEPYDIEIDSAGRILLSWSSINVMTTETNVGRLLANGKPDPTFGIGGVSRLELGKFSEIVPQIAIGQNDDVLIAGYEMGTVERNELIARLIGSGPNEDLWNNELNDLDTNGDRSVSSIDALVVLNYLNLHSDHTLNGIKPRGVAFIDVDGSNVVTPLDALLVFNFLNLRGSGEGEGANVNAAAADTTAVDTTAIGATPAVDTFNLVSFALDETERLKERQSAHHQYFRSLIRR